MGHKKVLEAYPIIVDGVMTGTNVLESEPTNIKNTDNFGIRISWTGTAIGVVSVMCSVDGVSYDALTFSPSLTQPAGASGSYLINLNQLPFLWVKVRYVNTSSTGTFNAVICGKDIN